jgi:hypothetical protein
VQIYFVHVNSVPSNVLKIRSVTLKTTSDILKKIEVVERVLCSFVEVVERVFRSSVEVEVGSFAEVVGRSMGMVAQQMLLPSNIAQRRYSAIENKIGINSQEIVKIDFFLISKKRNNFYLPAYFAF